MSLPSIKLNIFRKLEYFLVLEKLNKQFDAQLMILKSRKWDYDKEEKEHGFGDDIEKEGGLPFRRSVYPTWEAEKKVLFWAYAFHKLLKHNIKDKHLEDMLITSRESVVSGGISSIFGNLEMRGFGECKNGEYHISKDGLAFGEILWYLYVPKDGSKEINVGDEPKSFNYFQIYKANYKLKLSSWGWWILEAQLISFYFFLLYAVAFFSFELLKIIGLLDNLQNHFNGLDNNLHGFIVINLAIFLPFLIFSLSLAADFIYSWIVVDKKFKEVEQIRKKNKT